MSNNTECVTNGDTLLHEAVRNVDFHMAKTCIEAGMNPNIKNNYGDTPLHIAPIYNNMDMIVYLVKNGADMDAKDNFGETPLTYAVNHSDYAIVKYMLDHGANVNSSNNIGESPVFAAVWKNYADKTALLVEYGADIHIKGSDGFLPLHIAAKSGYVELMEYLINNLTLNVRTREGNTALYLALLRGHQVASRLLLQHGADIHIKGSDGFLPLHIAAKSGCASLIKDLSDGSIINDPTPTGSTALHYAVSSNMLESVQVLVELKARINVRNNYGDTPLHIAVNCDYRDIIIYLIGHGADTNIAPKVQFKLENDDGDDYNSGYNDGHVAGYDVGYNDGYSQGLEDGKGNGDGN